MCIRDRYEQAKVIENNQERTLIINKDDSTKIINTRKEYKIKFKRSYLVHKNIQFDGYMHSSKTIKNVTQLKHMTRRENTQHNYQPQGNYNRNYNHDEYKPTASHTVNRSPIRHMVNKPTMNYAHQPTTQQVECS